MRDTDDDQKRQLFDRELELVYAGAIRLRLAMEGLADRLEVAGMTKRDFLAVMAGANELEAKSIDLMILARDIAPIAPRASTKGEGEIVPPIEQRH